MVSQKAPIHWTSLIVIDTFKGDVVRIAPNELAFFSHQAFKDVLGGQSKGLETFVKTDFNRRGEDSGGIIYEEDPVQHRQLLKQLSPAFSSRSLKAMEPVLHHHIDLFVQKMSTKGKSDAGVSLVDWTNWLTMDIAADMAYCQDKGEMEEGESASFMTFARPVSDSLTPDLLPRGQRRTLCTSRSCSTSTRCHPPSGSLKDFLFSAL